MWQCGPRALRQAVLFARRSHCLLDAKCGPLAPTFHKYLLSACQPALCNQRCVCPETIGNESGEVAAPVDGAGRGGGGGETTYRAPGCQL